MGYPVPKPNFPEISSAPMSVHSKVLTPVYYNRFQNQNQFQQNCNHLQQTREPQFLVQELFYLETQEPPCEETNDLNEYCNDESDTQTFHNTFRTKH